MDSNSNSIKWFEIPVIDFDRARHFYQVIFSMHMETSDMMGMQMAMFPNISANGKASGALVKSEFHVPSMDGVIIYLNGNPDLNAVLEKLPQVGGEILMPKTPISEEIGYMAFFRDSEGNRIGLHSQE